MNAVLSRTNPELSEKEHEIYKLKLQMRILIHDGCTNEGMRSGEQHPLKKDLGLTVLFLDLDSRLGALIVDAKFGELKETVEVHDANERFGVGMLDELLNDVIL